jgi:hypothetical protein
MKINTNELKERALDWAVSVCVGQSFTHGDCEYEIDGRVFQRGGSSIERRYSTDWSQGGPIIEREKIDVLYEHDLRWVAVPQKGIESYGPTPLIAAMRCYVASKLGDTVEIPEGLT